MTTTVTQENPQTAMTHCPPQRARRAANAVLRGLEAFIGLLVIAAVLLNVANICGRHVMGQSIIGADEILVYTMVAIIFLGVIAVTARDAHLRMNMLSDLAPARVRRALRRVEWLVLAGLVGLMSWLGGAVALNMNAFGQKSLSAGIPMGLPHGIVAASLGFCAIIALGRAVTWPEGTTARPANDQNGEGAEP